MTVATVGSPGVFHPEIGQVALAHSLPGWGRQGLVEAVRRELGTNVLLENDVNLAALGEQWHGLGKGVDDYVYLHLGTGVGLGIVIGGELHRGHSGAAGEVGYLPLVGTDPVQPRSRRRGALDEMAGASARRRPRSPDRDDAAAHREERLRVGAGGGREGARGSWSSNRTGSP